MNNFDLEKTLSTMVICVDSREKKNSHILAWFDKHGIEYEVKKLDVGDYMIDGGAISVDTKRSIDELSTNMLNRADHARFWQKLPHSSPIDILRSIKQIFSRLNVSPFGNMNSAV